jgi:cadmium resistance protein CadD (predicted permease)
MAQVQEIYLTTSMNGIIILIIFIAKSSRKTDEKIMLRVSFACFGSTS